MSGNVARLDFADRASNASPAWMPPVSGPAAGRRIVFAIHMLGQGGTDRVCVHLANGFSAAGHTVEIVAFCASGDAENTLLPLIDPAVRITFLGGRTGSRPRDLAMSFPFFVRHLRGAGPDCVMSSGNNMNWITALGVRLARLGACRVVLKTTNPIVRPNDPLIKRVFRAHGYASAFAAADLVLTLSDPETALLRRAFPEVAASFRTVANPYVTPVMLAPMRLVPQRPGGERLVLGVGRFSDQKRMDLLLRAVANVRTPRTRLVLLGDGPGRASLERLATELGLQASIAMPGFVDNVADWFGLADLFVLPSAYEGLPAVVLEAMAANCPVVATDCFPAATTLVGGAPGCAVLDNADPVRLAGLIDAALARPRPVALRRIAMRYSLDQAVADHLAAIDSLFPVTAPLARA